MIEEAARRWAKARKAACAAAIPFTPKGNAMEVDAARVDQAVWTDLAIAEMKLQEAVEKETA